MWSGQSSWVARMKSARIALTMSSKCTGWLIHILSSPSSVSPTQFSFRKTFGSEQKRILPESNCIPSTPKTAKTLRAMPTVFITGLMLLISVLTRIRSPLALAMMRRGRSARKMRNILNILSTVRSTFASLRPSVRPQSRREVVTIMKSSLFHPFLMYSEKERETTLKTASLRNMMLRNTSMFLRASLSGELSPISGRSMPRHTEDMKMHDRMSLSK
mmetsp:Transcript_39279/g.91805  ORF Transcript_39279/g.91805 Transcript_39279/m.91805 type:complete len:217 (-) Transcript_39279:598-1248(-)